MNVRSRELHRPRRLVLAAVVALAASVATAAGAGATSAREPTGAPVTGSADDPVAGGSLTYLNLVDMPGFDPAIGQVNVQFFVQNYAVYDALAYESPTTGAVELGLLESGESTDALTWTLKLKPGVQFSDGTPLDAEGVKFNWERLADPATAAVHARFAQAISSIEVIDPTTFEVVLLAPDGQFLRTIATSALMWIASPTAVKADPEGLNAHPVGAGPYVVKEYVPGSQTVFERNPNYYGTTYVDEFTVKTITDEAQRLATLQAGDGDIMVTSNVLTANQANDAGLQNVVTTPNGGTVLFFNTQREPFDDVRLRQAFALAFDGQELTDAVYAGGRAAPSNMFGETSPFYDERFDQPEADAAAAQQLFDEIAAERGEPLEVTLSYIEIFTSEAQWYQAKLAGFDNVSVNLEVTPASEFQTKFASGEYEFGIHAINFLDPVQLAKYIATGAPVNFFQVSDADVDAALAAGASSLDEQERIEIYAPVQQMLLDEVPFKFVLRQPVIEVFNDDTVHGMGPESRATANGFTTITEVWVTG